MPFRPFLCYSDVVSAEVILLGKSILSALLGSHFVLGILLVHGVVEFAANFLVDMLGVDEVAVAASVASTLAILAALGLAEVSHRRELCLDYLALVEFAEHGGEACLSLLLGRVL